MLSVLREVLLQSWRVIMNGQQVSQLIALLQQHYRFESSPRWLPAPQPLAELESIAREPKSRSIHPPVHESLPPEEPSLGPQRASGPDGPFCAGCPVAARCGSGQLPSCGCPARRSGQAEPLRHRCGRAGES